MMTIHEQGVMAGMAIKLDLLERENASLKERMRDIEVEIFGIGGPLNDNKLGYSMEQLYPFQRIADLAEYIEFKGE